MSSIMQQQTTYIKELYAIIKVMNKFRHYLVGHYFIICTNQQALKYLCNQSIQTPEQQDRLPKLLGFDFNTKYKFGVDNLVVDALLRCFLLAFSNL